MAVGNHCSRAGTRLLPAPGAGPMDYQRPGCGRGGSAGGRGGLGYGGGFGLVIGYPVARIQRQARRKRGSRRHSFVE
jgi:hypothetical protein